MSNVALVIDDEKDIRELITMSLNRIGLEAHCAANLEEAHNLLSSYTFDICLTDMRLPDGSGVDFLKVIHSIQPNLPVAVITAHGNMNAAVEAMKNGAFDFVSKPVDLKQLKSLILQALKVNNQEVIPKAEFIPAIKTSSEQIVVDTNRHSAIQQSLEQSSIIGANKLVGNSQLMKQLRTMIGKVSRTNAPAWITGESGTGKELIAKLVHQNSVRRDKPFIAVNCGAIPSELMESEFFGHKKGSFTGAHDSNNGLFRKANGGTLFFDEIAELPLHMQVKLLRVIQERAVRGIGEAAETPVDVRILSASHKNLEVLVTEGLFRHDLYYRLNVISIRSPALRERPGDIKEIVDVILKNLSNQAGDNSRYTIDASAIEALEVYEFPGNVRELENILERAIALSEGHVLAIQDLNLNTQSTATPQFSDNSNTKELVLHKEVEEIKHALLHHRWNRKAAARTLGITYRQLRYRIQQYGLDEQ